MNLIKIVTLLKKKFSEFYDIKLYRKHASDHFVVRRYTTNNQRVIVDEEKSNE